MPIFPRYVVAEVLKIFGLALAGLTMITTLGMGLREGLRMGFPPSVMLAVMPYLLPEILGMTLPVAVLFAVTHVLSSSRPGAGNRAAWLPRCSRPSRAQKSLA